MNTKKRWKVKVELVVIRVKRRPSQQWGGADLTAAFLTLGAHEWPGCLAAAAAGWVPMVPPFNCHRLSRSPGEVICALQLLKSKGNTRSKTPPGPKCAESLGRIRNKGSKCTGVRMSKERHRKWEKVCQRLGGAEEENAKIWQETRL